MIKKYNEHIAYLQDDKDDIMDPNEIISIVGIPSGLYHEIKRSEYQKKEDLSTLITWSEKYKCYVYRDKDYPIILRNLDSEVEIERSNSSIDNVLAFLKIKSYKITNKGAIIYQDVHIKHYNMKVTPIKFHKIHGDFIVQDIKLSNMFNFPNIVEGNFVCRDNDLLSLSYGPSVVGLTYDCSHNRLESLYGAPMEVNSFDCSHNRLKSLLYGPSIANGDFNCNHNEIRSLRDAPISVAGTFDCSYNQLIKFDGMPKDATKIIKNNNKIF